MARNPNLLSNTKINDADFNNRNVNKTMLNNRTEYITQEDLMDITELNRDNTKEITLSTGTPNKNLDQGRRSILPLPIQTYDEPDQNDFRTLAKKSNY